MATPFTTYKLIVLYMLENLEIPISGSQISDFILEHEYTNYFQLQQAISELADADLLSISKKQNMSYYRISEEGRLTLSYFENEISKEIKLEVQEYLRTLKLSMPKREVVVTADVYETPHNGYVVRCQLLENSASIIDLTISTPNQEAAEVIGRNWKQKNQSIYDILMEELLV